MSFWVFLVSCVKISEPEIGAELTIKVPENMTAEAKAWRENYSNLYFKKLESVTVDGKNILDLYYVDVLGNIEYYRVIENSAVTNTYEVLNSYTYYFDAMANNGAYYYKEYNLAKKLYPILTSTNTIPKNMIMKEYRLITIITNRQGVMSMLEYKEFSDSGMKILDKFYSENFIKDEGNRIDTSYSKDSKLAPIEDIDWSSFTNTYKILRDYIDVSKKYSILGYS